ncbi:tRNA guanosine-2'-O-methyltransferase [Suillus paluster]|uniref:tRNA guanosine-2'-O-methyltransferase n=1 Tax=Suillus paluster TaxID=48578 RepID=UPI001B872E6D|nr:tRNA guanosine-2'-O-methyltransferase [Suillus paluster]KAG1732235.1 tRNA guanosine-2'-O-methyltransferase [Suillus paluster]
MEYLFVFAQSHEEFRVPELLSISELHGFAIGFDRYASVLEEAVKRPFMILMLDKEEHAKILAQRCIMIKSIHEFYAEGTSYEALHEQTRRARPQWERYIPDTSFKFSVLGYNFTIGQRRQREIIESFAYMDFLGKIDMKNPEVTLTVFEEYESSRAPDGGLNKDGEFKQVYFGRLVADGTARTLMGTFDVKKRQYFGNTSMEAEISLLMANQTLASPGKLIYDPFIGTGSMAYTTAYFGALVYGSDIDGRQMRGKDKTPGILRAAAQYGVASRIMDLCTFDVTNHPWRCGSLFDAIITDPPYGVRAGAKRLGRKKIREDRLQPAGPRPNEPYIPPTKPYELSQLITDLAGRLVFFLPTVSDEYALPDIHAMLCEGMELVANSLQDFGSWGRRLITIKKTAYAEYLPPSFDSVKGNGDFREKYFQGFKKDGER